ncbi:uncharacterized protein RJT21DRAFT_119803 [Scheffersomyces amazonensis]|uniref:uncharacterized protein n=1 Tax=Scheffersomyces amazonensis TaxID=1078765 RepID=UPI00315E0256
MARFSLSRKNKNKKKTDPDPDSPMTVSSANTNNTNNIHSNINNIHSSGLKKKPSFDTVGSSAQSSTRDSVLLPIVPIIMGGPHESNISATTPWKRYKLYDSPFPRYRHAASSISSEKHEIFLMGGLKEGSVFGDTWKIVPDDSSGEITSYSAVSIDVVNHNNPPARVGHSSVLCGNAFIIFGGDTVDTDFNGFPDNNFYLFNINNNKYTIPSHILSKPNGRYGHTIGVVSLNNSSSRLYLFGGQLENDVFNDLYFFELNTFKSPKAKWELVEPLNNFKPPPLTNHSMAIYKNKLYVFGGVYNNEKVSNDLWSYDPLSNKWSQIPTTGNIPLPVNEHSSCVVNDKLFVYGGNDFKGVIYNSLYVLDLISLIWSKLTSVGDIDGPGSRCGHSMSFIPKYNKLLIMGGDKNDYVIDDSSNFETYEAYNGEEVGTMIYELDLNIVDHFLSQTVVEPIRQKKPVAMASSAKVDDGLKSYDNHARSFSAGPEDFRTPHGSPPLEKQAEIQGSSGFPEPEYVGDNLVDVHIPSAEVEHPESPIAIHNPRRQSEHGIDLFEAAIAVGGIGAATAGATASTATSTKDIETPSSYHNGHASLLASYDYGESNENIPPVTVLDNHGKSLDESNVSSTTGGNTSQEDSKIKNLVKELTKELTDLRTTTKLQMQNATERIHRLEQENNSIRDNHSKEVSSYEKRLEEKDGLISELKSTVDPSVLAINEEEGNGSSNTNVSDLTRYKLERLELNNKLLYLEQENGRLNSKFEEFEPFMNNQIGELAKFQKLIKAQEEKISKLSAQTKDQELLTKEVNEWKSKYDNLQLEYENYKNIHSEEEISDDEEYNNSTLPESSHFDEPSNRSIISNATSTGRRSKKDISNQLESLVNLWNSKHQQVQDRESTPDTSFTPENNPIINKLQEQIEDLIKVGKQNDEDSNQQISELKAQLNDKLSSLKSFEQNYRDALQSVNNTSKALKLTQEELKNQKALLEKLNKENNELKLFKKANKRISTRNPSPIISDFKIPEEGEEDGDGDGDVDEFNNAHYNMKIKDLEADIYIIKQERDQLKENVTNLQKQLYLAQSGDSP